MRTCTSLVHIDRSVFEDLLDKVLPVVLGGLDEGRLAVGVEAPVGVDVGVAEQQLDNLEMR